MRAAVLHQVGDDKLEVADNVSLVDVGAGEVRVAIRATGVCHTDLSAMRGIIPTQLPAVLGHEGAGEVVEVGPGVPNLSVGDHVIVAWVPPCGVCARCLNGEAHLCTGRAGMSGFTTPRFRVGETPAFAFVGVGTMAEEIVLPYQSVVRIADDLPFDLASLIGCGIMTGVGAALNAARVRPGSSVVVFGCGGVGMSVIQGARIAGAAEIVAVDPVAAKREAARPFGASHTAAPEELDELKGSLTGGEGFDFAFEAVGIPATIRAAYDAARRGGVACIVGAGGFDDKVEFNAFELFSGDRKLVGTLYGSGDVRRDFPMLVRLWRTGRLDLAGMITKRAGLGDINTALADMVAGTVIRTVLVP